MPASDLDDDGSAPLEFILVGVVLLVPLVYLIVALGLVQAQTLGAEAGARHMARAIASASNASDAGARADRVFDAVAGEYGLDRGVAEVRVTCAGGVPECPSAGAMMTVTVATRVALPLVPPVFGLERLASVPIEASAVQKVSRFWGDS
jgi:Flp pilus assembly protein TadG